MQGSFFLHQGSTEPAHPVKTNMRAAKPDTGSEAGDRLNELLVETFPASGPLPLWSGGIGPPAGGERATA
ncbi:hypothetical protein [Cribrihabitans pelagius]|uniref:hypothetical protein n=1 Tax=Cribrihabitans pelagius TaxID=1765746 RepID=UPI003B5B32BB